MPVSILTAVLSVVCLCCMHDYMSLLSAMTKARFSSTGSCVCKLVAVKQHSHSMPHSETRANFHMTTAKHECSCCVCVTQDGTETETLVPSGSYNIAFARTPAEVLAIVYLGSPSTPGGFFPNGVNGNIQG